MSEVRILLRYRLTASIGGRTHVVADYATVVDEVIGQVRGVLSRRRFYLEMVESGGNGATAKRKRPASPCQAGGGASLRRPLHYEYRYPIHFAVVSCRAG